MVRRLRQLLRPMTLGVAGLALLAGSVAQAAGPVAPQKATGPAQKAAVPPQSTTARPLVAQKVNTAAAQASNAAHAAVQKTGKMRNRDRGSFALPSPNSAWEKLGFKGRFFKVGDAWRMAWTFRTRRAPVKRYFSPAEKAVQTWSAPVLIDYRVSKVNAQHIGGRVRQVATITAVYSSGVRGRMQHGNELKVDHYLNPVERCAYTKWTPYGTCRDRDTRSVVRSLGAIPLFIGDIEHLPAVSRPLPALAPTLQSQASRMVKGGNYLYVPVSSGRSNHADTFWATGHLMPSYVTSKDAQGILVGERIVR